MKTKQVAMVCLAGWMVFTGCKSKGPKHDPNLITPPPVATLNNLTVAPPSHFDPNWLQPGTNPFTLGPGDRLELEIIGEPATRTMTTVGPDGKIYFDLLPGLEVWGLSLVETKALLEAELRKLIQNEPKVGVTLRAVESKRVWLLGRLNKPGLYPMAHPMTLLEAISLAGGTTTPTTVAALGGGLSISVSGGTDEIADLSRSFVIRDGRILPVDFAQLLREGDTLQNIYLQPDDFVYLPSAVAAEVFVLGAVAQPQAIAYRDRMTLAAAVAHAGGTIKDAYLSHVAIVRGSMSQPQIAIVDYRDLVKGKGQDAYLEPRDIVYVPYSPYRILNRYVDLILNTFARTVGANAGARAVDPDAVPVSPDVSVGIGINSSSGGRR